MKKSTTAILLLTLLALLLSACSPSANPTTQPLATVTDVVTLPATAESAPTHTATSTPQPGVVLFVSASDMAGASIQPVLAELSSAAGLALETRTSLKPSDLSPAVRVVVMMTPPANLADLAALLGAGPQTQFVVFSSTDLIKTSSLSVIHQPVAYQAFVAGFISTLLSTDYRAAGLLPADGPLGAQLKDAFVNGGHYFCGVCAPGWPLRVYYPVTAELPSASGGDTWQNSATDLFDNQKAEVFYLSPESLRPELIAYLQGRMQVETPVLLLGAQTPPSELRSQWAATIRYDLAEPLRQIWPDLLAGKGGADLQSPLLLEDVNPRLLGEGRLRLVNELLQEIKAERIYPYSVPIQ